MTLLHLRETWLASGVGHHVTVEGLPVSGTVDSQAADRLRCSSFRVELFPGKEAQDPVLPSAASGQSDLPPLPHVPPMCWSGMVVSGAEQCRGQKCSRQAVGNSVSLQGSLAICISTGSSILLNTFREQTADTR